MYRIKGSDQKEYGPITADQVRQWIQENRLNRFSLAEKDGEPGWKPLGQFAEFADLFPAQPAGTAPAIPTGYSPVAGGFADPQVAAAKVKAPGILFVVFGVLGLLLTIAGPFLKPFYVDMMMNFFRSMNIPLDANAQAQMEAARNAGLGAGDIFGLVLGFTVNVLILIGGLKMMKLQAWGLALTAAILVMLPCGSFCCCLGLPLGIWAVILLNKPEVKGAFR